MESATFKVGDLARRTGLSVRTLHFYEEIGLLKPGTRSEGGHRLYGPAEVARLQRITSMRALGFTLEEIGDLLDGREGRPDVVIQRHLEHLRRQIADAGALVGRLERLAERLSASETIEVDDFLLTIQETVMHEKYYTDAQREEIEARRQALGEEGMKKGHQDWGDLIAEATAAWKENQGAMQERTGIEPGLREWIDQARNA